MNSPLDMVTLAPGIAGPARAAEPPSAFGATAR